MQKNTSRSRGMASFHRGKSSMFWLYNALVKLSNSAPSCYKISEILKEKPEDVLMWCMSIMGDKLELPAPLDENNILMVTMNGWMGRGVDNILDINLNGLKYLHLEYDHEDKTLHQYTYNDPHNDDFTNEQIIDVSLFKETSSLGFIAELEDKYSTYKESLLDGVDEKRREDILFLARAVAELIELDPDHEFYNDQSDLGNGDDGYFFDIKFAEDGYHLLFTSALNQIKIQGVAEDKLPTKTC